MRIGRTAVTFGDYWRVESSSRGTATARAAFIEWLTLDAKSLFSSRAEAPLDLYPAS
jgi:hypothetical protein